MPSYASTAWYHKKLPADLQQRDLHGLLRDVEQFAAGPYATALGKGDSISPQERQSILDQLTRFTGLDRSLVDEDNLRITQWVFCRELLRSQRLMVGRLDSRFTGPESLDRAKKPTTTIPPCR